MSSPGNAIRNWMPTGARQGAGAAEMVLISNSSVEKSVTWGSPMSYIAPDTLLIAFKGVRATVTAYFL